MDSELNLHVAPSDKGDVVFRTGDAPRIFQYGGCDYKAYSIRSLCDLILARGAKERCIVFATDEKIRAILDDAVVDRPQDNVSYDFRYSVQAMEWKEILTVGKSFTIKELSDFLLRREQREIENLDELLYAVRNFKYVTNVAGDFSFEDRNNYTFNIRVNEAEGTVRVPKVLNVNLEIFLDSGFIQPVEIEIEVKRPKDQSESPGFLLLCPKFGRYLKASYEHELATLRETLKDNGCLIVLGSPW